MTEGAPLDPPLDPRRHLTRPGLADAALKGRVQATAWVTPTPMRVRVPLADLRSLPRSKALAAQLPMGWEVRVARTAGGMAWVQEARDGYVGYVEEAALAPPAAPPTHRVAAPLTHAYPAADIKTAPRAVLPMNALLGGLPADGFLATEAGFVPMAALTPVNTPAPDLAGVAEALLGAPYLWGGDGATGIDCSGLIAAALRACGRPAPRDSDMQAAEVGAPLPNPWAATDAGPGTPAPALRRGDLVFWRGHVAMMLDATRMIHANAHHMAVTAEPLAGAVDRIAATTGRSGTGAGLPTALRRP